MFLRGYGLALLALTFSVSSVFSDPARPARRPRHCLYLAMDMGEGEGSSTRFWRTSIPHTVQTPTGPKAFAYGFDAELWHVSDVLAIINKDPESRKAAAAIMKATEELQFTRAKMRRMLNLNEEELNEAVKANKRNAEKLTFADIKINHLKKISHDHEVKSNVADNLYELVTKALTKRGVPVVAELEGSSGDPQQGRMGDGSAVELVMNGAMTKPKEFRDIIKKFLYKDTEWPETHFHVSVPSDAVTTRQMLLAARALEAKIILEELVAELKYDGTLAPYDDSALAVWLTAPSPTVGRGVVRVTANRWPTPVPAHDVEIRMWLDADHGLGNMEFMMKLVQNASRLRDHQTFNGIQVPNIVPANLNASLRYAALMLKDRLPRGMSLVPAKLEAFATEIEAARALTPAKRKEIAKFFKENDLLKHMSIETFLNEEE